MNKDAYHPSTVGAAGFSAPRPATMIYLCADCGAHNSIQAKEVIRCRECGHRVMYKMRTKRMVQFEAR
ncbi:DNA-directed RNA polymerase I [Schizosaccharomyces japonicus yFS275]|uniref:DNA-directed RNA polymerase I n=1 Tax=Schizosaccharomyces japonicus (strain yFS275 / FY16936) TaxID=402676 RepID=B6K0B9_SCHJY|nr:DNA-directed RNA polymerase I [Schizosaccharomyces japonicus yFS275]EEB06269.1 DNA-directed RNA polymerase I [Schizosaccharomyces japonicus yFS275]